jgi:ketosteroid isomerase-like protein
MGGQAPFTGLDRTDETRLPEPRKPGRRRFLRLAALVPLTALAPALPAFAQAAAGPGEGVDLSGASPELAAFMMAFFDAKSRRDLDATMAFFSPDLVTYVDATLGWDLAGRDALKGVYAQYMPNWPETARSSPTRIVGDLQGGAFVAFTDTPELFGGELRLLGAIDFKDGRILRWIDHWDSRGWPNAYGIAKAPLADYRESGLPAAASPRMTDTATRLFAAFGSGDMDAADAFLSEDVVFEDMALRAQLLGRRATLAYLGRALPGLPYGGTARLRHVVGSDAGGAIEWSAATSAPVRTGVTGVVLDGEGRIARLTTVYDGGLYDSTAMARMSAALLNI